MNRKIEKYSDFETSNKHPLHYYVEYIKTNLQDMSAPVTIENKERRSPDELIEYILYHLLKKNRKTYFTDVEMDDLKSFSDLILTDNISGSIFEYKEREAILVGTDEETNIVVYHPGWIGLTLTSVKINDLFYPDAKSGMSFSSGTRMEITLTEENRDFLLYNLCNKTNANRITLGKKIFDDCMGEEFGEKWKDSTIKCTDKKVPFIISSCCSDYFFAYFRYNQTLCEFDFHGPSYLILDYLHFLLTTEHLDFEFIKSRPEEFVDFGCYIVDYDYLYCILRGLEVESSNEEQKDLFGNIKENVRAALCFPKNEDVMNHVSYMFMHGGGGPWSNRKEFLLTLVTKENHARVLKTQTLSCLDRDIEVNPFMTCRSSRYLFDAVKFNHKINIHSFYILEYQKYLFGLDYKKRAIIENIFDFIDFAKIIEDYEFLGEIVNIFFSENTSHCARQEINQIIKDMKCQTNTEVHRLKEDTENINP